MDTKPEPEAEERPTKRIKLEVCKTEDITKLAKSSLEPHNLGEVKLETCFFTLGSRWKNCDETPGSLVFVTKLAKSSLEPHNLGEVKLETCFFTLGSRWKNCDETPGSLVFVCTF